MRTILALVLILGGCGSDDHPGRAADATFLVGGVVRGLEGTDLVLRLNGSDQRILGGGAFYFYVPVEDGIDYEVTVRANPVSPAQICTVTNASGTVDGADVTDITVDCVNDSFSVGGSVTGLAGDGLLLQNNGMDIVAVDEDGPFTFPIGVGDARNYAVSVFAQPSNPDQTCTVTGGSGVVAGADVMDVAVTCVTP